VGMRMRKGSWNMRLSRSRKSGGECGEVNLRGGVDVIETKRSPSTTTTEYWFVMVPFSKICGLNL